MKTPKIGLLHKLSAFLLTVVFLLSVFSACAGGGPSVVSSEVTTAAAEETERLWLDDLEDKDFSGALFSVCGAGYTWNDPGPPDVSRKDVVSAAHYDRYHNIQERFNVRLGFYAGTVSNDIFASMNELRYVVQSGMNTFDVSMGISGHLAPMAMEGCVVDMATIPEFIESVDLTKPWWSKEYTDELSVGPYRYWIYGVNDDTMYSGAFCIFFNKDMASLFLEDDQTMYDYVYNGTWTLDKLYELEKGAYKDDGNGTIDENDSFGFAQCSANYTDKIALAAGAEFTRRDEDNIPYAVINSERNITLNEKLYDLVHDPGYYGADDSGLGQHGFESGQIMMYMGMVGSASYYRDLTWDFGLLPMPKYNETDEEYSGSIRYSAQIAGIPVTTPSDRYDMIFTILEANAAEIWRIERPAFLDEGLKNKYSRDEDTKNMVDLTQQNINTDFVILYSSTPNGGYEYFFYDSVKVSRDISSTIARKEKPLNKQIANWLDKFEEASGQ